MDWSTEGFCSGALGWVGLRGCSRISDVERWGAGDGTAE